MAEEKKKGQNPKVKSKSLAIPTKPRVKARLKTVTDKKPKRKSLSDLRKYETKPFTRRYVTKQYFNHNGVVEIKVEFIYKKTLRGRPHKMVVVGVSDIREMGEANIKFQVINAFQNAYVRFRIKSQLKTGVPFIVEIKDFNCLYFNTRYDYRQIRIRGQGYVYVYRDKQIFKRHKSHFLTMDRVVRIVKQFLGVQEPNAKVRRN